MLGAIETDDAAAADGDGYIRCNRSRDQKTKRTRGAPLFRTTIIVARKILMSRQHTRDYDIITAVLIIPYE